MLRSLANVMKKELIQAFRDRRMLFMIVVAPIVQLVLFGYAMNFDVDRIPTVACDLDVTVESARLLEDFFAGGTFRRVGSVAEADVAAEKLRTNEASAAIVVARGFEERTRRGQPADVQVLVDGTDPIRAQVAENTAAQFFAERGMAALAERTRRAGGGDRAAAPPPVVRLAPRVFYNPTGASAVYMVPGICASLLLTLTSVMTAMGLAREREAGTLEQILVTPIRPIVLLLGKCLPFALIGLVLVGTVLAIGSYLFDVPMRGSFVVVGAGAFAYLMCTLGMGILLATVSGSQQQAILGAVLFMIPAMLLSGFMTPVENMPAVLRYGTLVNPMRHFIEIMRGCLLKGAGFADLYGSLLWLAGFGVTVFWLAARRFGRAIA